MSKELYNQLLKMMLLADVRNPMSATDQVDWIIEILDALLNRTNVQYMDLEDGLTFFEDRSTYHLTTMCINEVYRVYVLEEFGGEFALITPKLLPDHIKEKILDVLKDFISKCASEGT